MNDGGFVVAWQSNGQDGNLDGIFGQRYQANETLFGSEIRVNNYTTSFQINPTIAPLNDGGFVVAWQSNGQDGDNYGIFAQRFQDNGNPLGSEFQVNNYTTSGQVFPAIAPLNDGGFIVAWTSTGQDGNGYGIFVQRYHNNGALFGTEFQVNSHTTSDQMRPSIAPLKDDGFLVAWQSSLQDGDADGIFAQRYDLVGNPVPFTFLASLNSSFTLTSRSTPTSSSTSEMSEMTSSTFTSSPASSTIGMQSSTQSTSSSLSNVGIPALINVVYGDSYSITQNGQTIGTFTISGGTGQFSSSNPNTLNIEIGPNIVLQDGDTLTLFSAPEGEEIQWEGINLDSECFSAEGETVFNEATLQNDYQLIFYLDADSCIYAAGALKFGTFPVLAGGGLI